MKRLAVLLLLALTGCTAQTSAPSSPATQTTVPADVQRRIQQQVQAQFDLPADVKVSVGATRPSDFTNYDTVPVILSGRGKEQKVDFLLSKDGKTLARLTKIDLTKDVYAERMSKITVKDRPVRGNPDAKVTIVNFDDLQCPFCSRMHSTLMEEILPLYGDKVRIVYKDFPLSMHPWAEHAANNANCLAAEDGKAFWQFADYVHANQKTISGGGSVDKSIAELDRVAMDLGKKNGANSSRLQVCLQQQSDNLVKASMAEGEALGISATPTMFINGQKLEGAVDAEEVKSVINQQLEAAGIKPPAEPPAAPAKPAK